MKKFISILFTFLMFFGLASCGGSNDVKHSHNYSTDWSFNDSSHWHECLNKDGKCDSEKIDVFDHNFGEPIVKPNYASDGSIIYNYICKDCGYVKEELVKHVHKYDDLKYDDTYHWYECSSKDGLCNELVINKEKHNFDIGVIDPNDKSLTTYTCSKCNYQKQEYKGHKHEYSSSWTSDESYHWHECLNKDGNCDLKIKDLSEHTFNEGIVTQTPTPTVDGTKEYTCKECGFIKYEKISYFDQNTNYDSIVGDKVNETMWNKAFYFNNVTIKIKIDKLNAYDITESNEDYIKINPDKLFYSKFDGAYLYDYKYTFIDDNKNLNEYDKYGILSQTLNTDPAYNLLVEELNKKINIFKYYFENKFNDFKYDTKLGSYVSINDINGFSDINVKICNNRVVFISCKKETSQFNYKYYEYKFYDYDKTKMSFNLINPLYKNTHLYEKVKDDRYCGDSYCCLNCNNKIHKDHELNIVDETVSDINNPKKLIYNCNNCSYRKEKIEDHIYKQDDDFSAIVGENKEKFKFNKYNYTYSVFEDDILMFTIKKDDNIFSITNKNGVEQKFILINNSDEAIFVKNNIPIKFNYKEIPILKQYDITPIFEAIERNNKLDYDPVEKCSKLEFRGGQIAYFKIKNDFIPTIKIVEPHFQPSSIYNINLYDNGTTKIDVPPVHYDHTYSDYIYDNHEYSYRKCINTNGICLLKDDIHRHYYNTTITEPTFEKDGEIIHKCNNGNCNYQYSEPIKRILRENDDFINMKSEEEFKQHRYKSYKYKIEDVLKNEVHHISFEEIEDQNNHITTNKWVLDNKEVIEITRNYGQFLVHYTDGVTDVTYDYYDYSVEYQQIRERVNSIAIELNNLDFNSDYYLRYSSIDECFVPDSNSIFTLPLYGSIYPGDNYNVRAKVYDGTVAYAELENYKNNEMINHYQFYCYEVIYDYYH